MNTSHGRRRLLALAIVLTGLVTLPEARAATKTVSETGNHFVDQKVTITVGDRVVWQFADSQSARHSVTFDDNSFDEPGGCSALVTLACQGPGDSIERTFAAAGTFYYHCKIHGAPRQRMFGIVEVRPTSGTPGASTSSTARASSSTTTTTVKPTTSTTTTTTRPLATSSTVISSTTTTTAEATSVLLPGEPPPFSDDTSSAANRPGGSEGGNESRTVALIVGLLLAVSAAGGYLLWWLRPGRP
jgi:plastocyanin